METKAHQSLLVVNGFNHIPSESILGANDLDKSFWFPPAEATLSWQYWKLLVLEYQDHILSISGQILCIWELPCYRADIGNTFDRERTRAGRGVELESVCFLNTHWIISIHVFFFIKTHSDAHKLNQYSCLSKIRWRTHWNTFDASSCFRPLS